MRIDEIQILLDQGRIALNQGRFDESGELLDRVLKEDEANEQALNLKGLLLFKQERFAEAVDLFGTLVGKYPEEPTLLMNLGLAHLKCEDYGKAIEELEKALGNNPGNPKIHNYLGLAYSGIGRLSEAQDHFIRGGSKKMADQMLEMMQAMTGELASAEADTAGSHTVEPTAEEAADAEAAAQAFDVSEAEEVAEADVEEMEDVEVDESALGGDDNVDDAFDATFQPEPDEDVEAPAVETASGPDADEGGEDADVDEGVEADGADDAAGADEGVEADGDDHTDDGDEEASEEAADPAAAEAESPAAKTEEEPAMGETPPVPTDLLGSALHLLRDRYDAVLETNAGGKNLQELADLLKLERDPDATIDHVRPNVIHVRVHPEGTALARMDGVLALNGNIRAEPRKKRYKGKDINSMFGGDQHPVYELIGTGGVYLAAPEGASYFPLRLDGELVYLVERAFAAVSGQWRWENGRLPGQEGRDLHLVQLRGKGTAALHVAAKHRVAAITLKGQKMTMPVNSLAGWFGNIVPVLVDLNLPQQEPASGAVQFQGDGTVLVQIPGQ